ncbi:MAG: DNA translocase FtsK [Clostridia bacterium]|nr:DNA translocase FtsK [Clostridia bacterium]
MARISKKAEKENKIRKGKIISAVLILFSIYYFFISLRSDEIGNNANPLDSFGIIGGFFLRTFQQFFGGFDLLVIAFIILYAGYVLVTQEPVKGFKLSVYILLVPVLLGLLHISSLGLNTDFRIGFEEALSGSGAGMTGFLFAFLYIKLFGTVASYLVGVLTILLFALYLTDFPFSYIAGQIKDLFTGVKRKQKPVKEVKTKETAIFEESEPKPEREKNIIPIINNLNFTPVKKEGQEEAPAQEEVPVIDTSVKGKVVSLEEVKKEKVKEKESEPEKELEIPKPVLVSNKKKYQYPDLDILKNIETNNKMDQDIINRRVKVLEETLENFGVKGKISGVNCGPAITRYEFQPAPGVKVSKIVNLADDIALSMATAGVRIAPIPGKNAIGVEVPNKYNITVGIKSVLETLDFKKSNSKLSVALGKDIAGKPIIADLKKMPHLLVAGATGSGKSVCMNSIIASILFNASPDEVKLIMIDPKMVELTVYNGIPHLITPVVTDPKKAASALRWAVKEMENRYMLFSSAGVKSIEVYNENAEKSGEDDKKLPYIVVLIDELSDLMMVAPADVEDAICRIAQMARAAGIHLVIATQRPSVNVITGIIKANVPSRIAFAVSSQVDSRTILDMNGAEKLLGKGDMLYYPSGVPKPFRVQGVFISDDEIETLVMEIKSKGVPKYDEGIINQELESETEEIKEEAEEDELIPDAAKLFIENGQASISLLQRRFRVGYNRAARIIDQMEQKGIIGGYEGSKPRQILINLDDYDRLFENKEKS